MYNTGLLAKRILVLLTASYLGAQAPDEQSLPVATQWSMDAAGESGRAAIRSVVKIACSKAQTVGTGFQLDTGFIVTNAHVVGPCGAPDLLILSSDGGALSVSNLIIDPERDLAALRLSKSVETVGLKIHRNINPKIGDQFSTWGYPFGIPGPAPLWTFCSCDP
jgi:S1-C subfamily serine protease